MTTGDPIVSPLAFARSTFAQRAVHCALLTTLVALGSACASTDDVRDLRAGDPAPVVIAIKPAKGSIPTPGEGELGYVWDSVQIRDALISELTDLRAATEIVAANSANESRADVIITPHIRNADIPGHEGLSDSWWASGGLWLVTWVGGLFIDDSNYTTKLNVDFEIKSSHSDQAIVKSSDTGDVTLSFADRNGLMSWQTIQTFVLPPFWTTDSTASTSAALTSRMTRAVAVDLARYLKGEYATDNQHTATLRILQPKNGRNIGHGKVVLEGRIDSKEEIGTVRFSINNRDFLEFEEAEIERSSSFGAHRLKFKRDITQLAEPTNTLVVRFDAGDEHTRTIRFTTQSDG